MFKIIRKFIFMFVLLGVSNAWSAGYESCSLTYTSCSSGYYMTLIGSTTCNTTVEANNVCRLCSDMGAGYTCAGGTACPVAPTRTCTAGKYWNGSACATCTAGYYCPGFTNVTNPATNYGRNACPTNYTSGGTGLSAQNQCQIQTTAGKYIATANDTTQTTCAAGYACPAALINYGSTGTRNICTGATFSWGARTAVENVRLVTTQIPHKVKQIQHNARNAVKLEHESLCQARLFVLPLRVLGMYRRLTWLILVI